MTIRIEDPLFSDNNTSPGERPSKKAVDNPAAGPEFDASEATLHRRRLLDDETSRRLERLAEGARAALSLQLSTVETILPEIAIIARCPRLKASAEIRNIRTELLARTSQQGTSTVAVVSASSAKNSEYLAINLAVALALAHRPTLLIDAHFHRNAIAQQFNARTGASLASVVSEGARHDFVPLRTPIETLQLLPACSERREYPEGLSIQVLKKALGRLKENYAHIVIHAPPALARSEARFVLGAAEQAIVSVRRDRDRTKDLRALYEVLRTSGAHVLGAVLTK